MIYIWLKSTKKMICCVTMEEFQRLVDALPWMRNEGESIEIMIENNTKQWDD